MKTTLALSLLVAAPLSQAANISITSPGACAVAQSGDNISIVCSTGASASSISPPVALPPSAGVPSMCGGLSVTHIPMKWDKDNGVVYYNRTMAKGQAHIYSFTTGPAEALIASFSISEYAGSVPTRTVVVSTTPCDFNVANAAWPRIVGTPGTSYFSVGVPLPRRVMLQANTTYYVNIKNENPYSNPDQDACLTGENCGYRFNLNHSGK